MKSSTQLSELRPEFLATNGMRSNGRVLFQIHLNGVDVYDLFKLLRGGATNPHQESYLEVRKCVFLTEKIWNQVKRQGF